MKRILVAVVSVFILLCAALPSEAQINRRSLKKSNKRMANFKGRKEWFAKSKRYNAIGFSVNSLHYYGDLSPKTSRFSSDYFFTRPGIGVSFNHRFGPRYTLAFTYMYGRLRGEDAQSADLGDNEDGKYRYFRNLSFRNQLNELSALAYFDLFENDATYLSRASWTPYVYIGFSGLMHNPQAIAPATDLKGNPLPQAGEWVDLRPLGTEGQHSELLPTDANFGIKPYSRFTAAIPIGIGARFRLNDLFDLWVDIGLRFSFSDYLDDVSRNYVDLGVFKDPLAQAMSYRTNELPDEVLPPLSKYVARDKNIYQVLNGYGSEDEGNVRGNKQNNDAYQIINVRLTYIIGKTFHRAKFR